MEGARPATDSDVERLTELCRQVRSDMVPLRGGALFLAREARDEPLSRSFTDALASLDHLVVAGTIGEAVMGYAVGRVEVLRGGSTLGVIEDLFVEEGAQGVGIGAAMMNELVPWFEARDVIGIDAIALPGDRNTKNFFERSGFTARMLVMHHRVER